MTLDPIVFTPRFASDSISSAQLWNLQRCFYQTEEAVTFKFLWRQQIDHCWSKVCLELGTPRPNTYLTTLLILFYRDALKNAKWISRNDRINIKTFANTLKGYARDKRTWLLAGRLEIRSEWVPSLVNWSDKNRRRFQQGRERYVFCWWKIALRMIHMITLANLMNDENDLQPLKVVKYLRVKE